MANILELNSDVSDSDDADYVPVDFENSGCSDNDAVSSDERGIEQDGEVRKKKRKGRKKGKLKGIENAPDNEEETAVQLELSAEEAKKRAIELYESFKDVQSVRKRQPDCGNSNSNGVKNDDIISKGAVEHSKVMVTEEFEFAGETVKVTKEIDSKISHPSSLLSAGSLLTDKIDPIPKLPSSGNAPKRPAKGLSSVLGVLSKKPKISTLQKSLLDWNSFKREEGIDEDLKLHNKGKGGFLEKQAFLQRSDVRQFEIEKNVRLGKRTKP